MKKKCSKDNSNNKLEEEEEMKEETSMMMTMEDDGGNKYETAAAIINDDDDHSLLLLSQSSSSSLSKRFIKSEYANNDLSALLPTYKHAKRLMKTHENSGLVRVRDQRHITIGWHQCGRCMDAIRLIYSKSLSRYRHQLEGVPLAFGQIKLHENPLIIGSQSCMHLDVSVKVIVFRPLRDQIYKCIVTSIGKHSLTAKIFNVITFIASLKDVETMPNIGDEICIRFNKVEFKGSLCLMKGTLVEHYND